MKRFCAFAVLFLSVSVFARSDEPAAPTELFADKNLEGWDFYLDDASLQKSDVWHFLDDGVLYCKGTPFGYLATKKAYHHFILDVQYRWPQGVEPSNSGIFLRITGRPTTLPQCVECQLKAGRAGDLYGFDGRKILGGADRSRQIPQEKTGDLYAVSRVAGAEKEPGQWNRLQIVCQEGTIIVSLNGQIVNWTLNADAPAGSLGFQSEGGPVEFRDALLTELP